MIVSLAAGVPVGAVPTGGVTARSACRKIRSGHDEQTCARIEVAVVAGRDRCLVRRDDIVGEVDVHKPSVRGRDETSSLACVRIARFRLPDATPGPAAGRGATGIVEGDEILDLGTMEPVDLLTAGPDTVRAAARDTRTRYLLDEVELLAPVPNPRKFLAIGINYADHIRETGREAPTFPVFFNKQITCVTGPHGPIHVPRVSSDVDFEGELGIVIGRRCRHVPVERAHEVIAGYLVVNDVTVRDWQYRSPTWTLGKSFDTHGPIGPWITTPDEVGDPQDLHIRTLLNGETMQDASTSEMIFGCSEQIATLSTAFTLEPGDLISTGTPAGVGFARQPPVFLRAGDTVRIEIDGMGAIENPVVDEPADTQAL